MIRFACSTESRSGASTIAREPADAVVAGARTIRPASMPASSATQRRRVGVGGEKDRLARGRTKHPGAAHSRRASVFMSDGFSRAGGAEEDDEERRLQGLHAGRT